MREQLQKLLQEATANVLLAEGATAPEDFSVVVVPSKTPDHGDFACSAPLGLAKVLKAPPLAIAQRIVDQLQDPDGILRKVEVVKPGFINLFLVADQWHAVLKRVLEEGENYGCSVAAQPERVMVEFVSANPTGPLTIGHGRNAILGDVIARLLEVTGHEPVREYYFNNAGRQMRVLGESLQARYEQALGRDAALPEDGYQGEYLVEIARAIAEEHGENWLEGDEDRFKKAAETAIFADIRATLDRLGIVFDVYYNENTLYEEGRVEAALEDLRAAGLVYEDDGAVWLRSKNFGLERDRVLVKSSGEATYLLPDIAYHREKFRRKFDRVIDLLGPDHIEQFPYVKAATGALGIDVERMELVVYQWVNLRSGGELVKMSTRKASFVTVDEVLDDVGPDVFRYFMIDRRADTHLDFDLDLAKERSDRNPVYKIQYAHARLCSIIRKAQDQGLTLPLASAFPYARLESPEEAELVKRMGRFPEILQRAAAQREPQEVTRYLMELATMFHTYVTDAQRHRVLSEDEELSRARLGLVSAVRTTLANGLRMLGITAPERM